MTHPESVRWVQGYDQVNLESGIFHELMPGSVDALGKAIADDIVPGLWLVNLWKCEVWIRLSHVSSMIKWSPAGMEACDTDEALHEQEEGQ